MAIETVINQEGDDPQDNLNTKDDFFLLKVAKLARQDKLSHLERNAAIELVLNTVKFSEEEMSVLGVECERIFSSFDLLTSLAFYSRSFCRKAQRYDEIKEFRERKKLEKAFENDQLFRRKNNDNHELRIDVNEALGKVSTDSHRFVNRFISDVQSGDLARLPRQMLGSLRSEYLRICNQSDYQLRKNLNDLVSKISKYLEAYS